MTSAFSNLYLFNLCHYRELLSAAAATVAVGGAATVAAVAVAVTAAAVTAAAVATVAAAVSDATAATVAVATALAAVIPANKLQDCTKQRLPPPKRNHVTVHQATLSSSVCGSSPPCRQFEGATDEGLVGAEVRRGGEEEEVHRLQAHLASRLSRANLYTPDDPLAQAHTSVLDLRDPLYTSSAPLRKAKVNIDLYLRIPSGLANR